MSDRHRDRDRGERRESSSSHRHERESHDRNHYRDNRRRSSRSPSPSPRRPDRNEETLPEEFSREREEKKTDDHRNALERMDRAYDVGPLSLLSRCRKEHSKIKVWTRNFKEVRGICTGYVTAFDKHWNLAMEEVNEIFLKSKKGKTPYLRNLAGVDLESIPNMEPKVPRVKSDKPKEEPVPKEVAEGERKKKKRVRKKSKLDNRAVDRLFIRGDNVVMISILQEAGDDEEEEEEVEEMPEEKAET